MITWITPVRPDGSAFPNDGTAIGGPARPCGGFIDEKEIDRMFPGNIGKEQTGPYAWHVMIPDSAKWAKAEIKRLRQYVKEMDRVPSESWTKQRAELMRGLKRVMTRRTET